MIETIFGPLDEKLLRKRVDVKDNAHEHTVETEYYMGNLLVRRDAHVTLKEGIGIEGIFGRTR